MNKEVLIGLITNAIEKSDQYESKLPYELMELTGFSGYRTRHFLNNLLTDININYLEIGCWLGSTLFSATYKNKVNSIYAIDNFSEFESPREEFLLNKSKFDPDNKIKFIESDCFNIDKTLIDNKINCYLYDGHHDADEQYNALAYYYDLLDDCFIFMVDDWNWENPRTGTLNAIKDLGLKIEFKHEVFMPTDHELVDWWNGFAIFVLSK